MLQDSKIYWKKGSARNSADIDWRQEKREYTAKVQLYPKFFKDICNSYITPIAHNAQEARGLFEAGLNYFNGKYCGGEKIFRKRK
jgi:hypothetical protein